MQIHEGVTRRFAEFVEGFDYRDIPEPVIARTKDILYDGLGAALAATADRYDILPLLSRFVRDSGGAPHAVLFGTDLRTNTVTAALANGTLSYYVDNESHHAGAIMHAIAVVAPAALAVGEKLHRSGRDLLSAIVLGIDVACRVSYALGAPALYARGFHPTCVAGTFGSMAAASRLLGLKGEQLLHAFGLAGTQASGLLAWVSDQTEHSRPFNMGLASRNGTYAAELAALGFGGPPAVFEGKYPLAGAFSGQWNEDELFRGLGTQFKVMELAVKRYACCAFIHPGLDGLLDIVAAERVAAKDIERITLRFPIDGYKVIDGNALRSHCAQYVMSLAAHTQVVEFDDIRYDRRSDPGIASLAERTRVIGDTQLNEGYPDLYRSIVEVETVDGHRYDRDVTHPKGSPENPLTAAELRAKFEKVTRGIISPDRAREIGETVARLDQLEDVAALTRLLASRPVAATPAGR